MNILILNWRDPQNPKSGGAEKVLMKYATHWTSQGHTVSWIASKLESQESGISNSRVKVFRIGPSLPFYNSLKMLFMFPLYLINTAYFAYCLQKSRQFNLIIDCIHGLPHLSPLYSNGRVVLFTCEVAGKIWHKMYPFPISLIGSVLEKVIYSKIYSRNEIWAISQNTRKDILSINPNSKVKVIPLGIDIPASITTKAKFPYPSAVFLARLVKMKGIESAVYSTRGIVDKMPDFILYVIAGGTEGYLKFIIELVKKLKLENNIKFLGKVSNDSRDYYLAKSHFLIHPSYKEGFGLTVLEAGIYGTPTIARSGSAMDELINNGEDGLLFDNDSEISSLFIKYYNSETYKKMTKLIKQKSITYSWENILSKHDITKF